ncbi:Zn-ribbon domain-containing OB-fold protein [Ornithinimicrobium cavernae]|uniref:Zn-ribbon domain-containing OB-fold protein n=1 Tax=Ornithinimicrobium cavernae TaxID=2666047 RepID=UPI001F450D80|nr:OB-fold domain-containing protein [Ornithinimicrobium cavernae]
MDVEPHGTLYSWTVVGHATLPGFESPYAVVLVELTAPVGVRLLGSYDGELADLKIGQPLTARPVQVTDEVHLLSWSHPETSKNPDDTDGAVATDDHDTEVGEYQ